MSEITMHQGDLDEALKNGNEIYEKYFDKPFYGIIFIARESTDEGFVFGEMVKTPDHILLALMWDALNKTMKDAVMDIIASEIAAAIDGKNEEENEENGGRN